LKRLGLGSDWSTVSKDLTLLWDMPTKKEFDSCLNNFLDKCASERPKYGEYFRDTWLDRYPPRDWAAYARPGDVPSGNTCTFSS
jgi:hypothetical protein